MLTSITLQNFKSFGEEQTIPLQPITVLVGPNNSGKSCLVSLAKFIRDAATEGGDRAFEKDGGSEFVFHRPSAGDGIMRIGWKIDEGEEGEGAYKTALARHGSTYLGVPDGERFDLPKLGKLLNARAGGRNVFFKLHAMVTGSSSFSPPDADAYRPIWSPLVYSTDIKLALPALKGDAEVVPDPKLGADGAGLPALLGVLRGFDLDRAAEIDVFIHKCLPEIAHVLVKPGPTAGDQRLWVQQTDGEQFDAGHISDGLLCFIALAMHVINAEPGTLVFVEEPEQSIHPRRIHDLVELFRTVVYERKCQIVMTTHSPVLLHEFKDEPEAILLFRRDETKGTRVNPLTDFKHLMEALRTRKADPGIMLTDGFLNEPS